MGNHIIFNTMSPNYYSMETRLHDNETIFYYDFCVRATRDAAGTPILKVQTDKGQLIIHPSAGNAVNLESSFKPK